MMRAAAIVALVLLAGCTAAEPGPVQVSETRASTCSLTVSIDADAAPVWVETSTDHYYAENESEVPLVALAGTWVSAEWRAENGTRVGWNRTVGDDCSVGGPA